MPEYSEGVENKNKEPCFGVKQELIDCLMASDCVQKVSSYYLCVAKNSCLAR